MKTNQNIINIQALKDNITSVAFTSNNLEAYISDWAGNIKIVKWQSNATSKHEFDITQKPIKVGSDCTYGICLTPDDVKLIVRSEKRVRVYNTHTKKITKMMIFDSVVRGIK